ncbi:MAG TPA: L,D-transpeptidase family protein [Thiobacillaceae bacterium]|nr:L,D-transpeptidase family protein [Thiobacillaceae bacterium]HNU63218.1 L,D-transpeptidase family protein [Thiobacillaceae bacterium]
MKRSISRLAATVCLLLATACLSGVQARELEAPILLAANSNNFLPSPDALIGKTLQDIRASRLDDALKEVNRVIAIRPDFKLAYLIKGDLLMARARPLAGVGAVTVKAPHDQSLSDLREEARVRMLRYIDQPDPSLLPRQILQLAPQQRYALLADASRARLYLFENVDGEPRLIQDYYMTIGRNGTDKRVEGDKRTPVGVYQVISRMPRAQLADLYGSGAFPLNYPNAWDQVQGRGGHGIWLHGVPSDTYSRPPRSSDGCLAVTNPDLNELSQYIQIGVTPIVITERADWVTREEWERSREDLREELAQWRMDWQTRDASRFLTHYAPEFLQGSGWAESKRRNIENKTWIKVGLRDASIFLYPGGDMAYAEFTQDYFSDRLSSVSRKQMYWKRHTDGWRIVLEKSRGMSDRTQLVTR